MAPSHSRHLFILATLPIAIILSYLWFKRKRSGPRSDVGPIEDQVDKEEKSLYSELIEAETSNSQSFKKLTRSLSGVESTPIDIIYPPELKSTKPTQVVITDEDLDLEIEKIKSMKSPLEFYSQKKSNSSSSSPKFENEEEEFIERAQEATEEKEIVIEPKEVAIEPEEAIAAPEEASAAPEEASAAPEEASAAPEEAIPEPEKAIPEPEETLAKPEKVITEPEDLIAKPEANCNQEQASECRLEPCNQVEIITKIDSPLQAEPVPEIVDMETSTKQVENVISKNVENANKKGNVKTKDKKKKKTKFHKLIHTTTTVEKNTSGKGTAKSSKEDRNQPTGGIIRTEELAKRTRERDSANHSPVEALVASSSMSSICSIEGSTDSGKGRSEVASPPSRHSTSDPADQPVELIHHFDVPERCCGKLIGLQGANITRIKEKSLTDILLKKYPQSSDKPGMNVCVVKGTQEGISRALALIRKRFPLKYYPDLTLELISFGPPPVPILPLEEDYIRLVDGIHNDTIVSCMVAPNHLFLHLHTHPTYPNLSMLNKFMNDLYNCDTNSPALPFPVPERTLCSAPSQGAWYRALVLSSNEEEETCTIQFLDYGGYATLHNSELKQIHQDFVRLPFQAAECILYNIKPTGDGMWHQKAYELVEGLTKSLITTTHVIDYTVDEIPLVNIYAITSHTRAISINAELVKRGYAEWIEIPEDCPQGAVGGLVG